MTVLPVTVDTFLGSSTKLKLAREAEKIMIQTDSCLRSLTLGGKQLAPPGLNDSNRTSPAAKMRSRHKLLRHNVQGNCNHDYIMISNTFRNQKSIALHKYEITINLQCAVLL